MHFQKPEMKNISLFLHTSKIVEEYAGFGR